MFLAKKISENRSLMVSLDQIENVFIVRMIVPHEEDHSGDLYIWFHLQGGTPNQNDKIPNISIKR